ncbi:MAG: class I SAM-dependent methyltransferase [Desulfobacterales bacterium]|jgi:methyltransferase-like protein/2-polyprenyl-3-methyl-5-hydroxy-6-metoxy-1,4-benzoquinol methylase|nr:class I SAM-dependent methyltransferase [Desulfobacterales bacterium]
MEDFKADQGAAITPYDKMPYPAGAYPQSHPDRLETLAALFGMTPPDLRSCRVLELGCADGSNLIPMACALPGSRFVGVDLSARQVSAGRKAIAALSLENIDLRHSDIRDIDQRFGTFDYIICHGVYSWVPAAVQQKILSICRERLHENGVAYISYNTYPGWRMRGMLRDMMLYHSRKFDDPLKQIEQARALIQWLSESVRGQNNPYGMLLRIELEQMRNWQDTYFRHDSLEEINEPVYFHEFTELAAKHGLKYLAEAEFPMMLAGNCGSSIFNTLERLGRDIIEMEQYMDFLRNRMFRQTLLCHEGVSLNRTLGPWCLSGLHCAAAARAAHSTPSLASEKEEIFHGLQQQTISSREPIVKTALVCLAECWPATLSLSELTEKARARIAGLMKASGIPVPDIETDRQTLAGALLNCFSQGICELHCHPVPFVLSAGEHPQACAWVRYSAHKGTVTSRRHEQVALDTFERQLVPLLDGCQDRTAIVAALTDLAASGALVVDVEGRRMQAPTELRRIMGIALEEKLHQFGRQGLLIR